MSFEEKYIKSVGSKFDQYLEAENTKGLMKCINFVEKHQKKTNTKDKDLYQAHFLISQEYSNTNNIKELLHLLKTIKFRPEDLSLRFHCLSRHLYYLNYNQKEWVKKDLQTIKKETFRYCNYFLMKWGEDYQAYNILLNILERINFLEKTCSEDPEGPLSKFCEEWEYTNSKYRPEDQALDYASQIIYEFAEDEFKYS